MTSSVIMSIILQAWMADLKESHLFQSLRQQSRHWYYSTKIYCVRKLLQRYRCSTKGLLSISDWGAGNGIIGISTFDIFEGSIEASLDLIDTGYTKDRIRDFHGNIRYRQKPELGKKYNVLMAIDVVEHINDDKGFVNLLERHMENGSLLILAAPALDLLWSSHDIYLEHYRRYNLHSLKSICVSANLKLLDSGYLFSSTLPIVLIVRLIKKWILPSEAIVSDMSILPATLNYILKSILRLETFLKLHFKLFAKVPGSTVFVVAQKHE